MEPSLLPVRERFRHASREILRHPNDRRRHEVRVLMACELDGIEPLQGALADMLHACATDADSDHALLSHTTVRQRLPAHVHSALLKQAQSSTSLPAANPLATRWSVLTSPSLDVPRRALLCSADDARTMAASAIPALLAGDADTERAFLAHCEGAGDTLAFMMARRALTREGCVLSKHWDTVLESLLRNGGT